MEKPDHESFHVLGSSYDSITRASGSSMGREELRIKRQPWVFVDAVVTLSWMGLRFAMVFPSLEVELEGMNG